MLLLPDSETGKPRRVPLPGSEEASDVAKGGRVLIVEDDYFVAMEIEHRLLDAGFEVTGIAPTADQAYRMAAADRPDIAIMDIRLAGLQDGIEAAITLRNELGVPSIFATAHTTAEIRNRAQAAQPVGWLQKPYSVDALIAALNAALGQPN